MSFSQPSHVSVTTGSAHGCAPERRICQRTSASCTAPTLCVFVIATGPSRKPDSSIHAVPVISPLPLSANRPAKTGSTPARPRGRMTVTPVRTAAFPPASARIVDKPTSTPATSVMPFSFPGMPSNGTPRSRARGFRFEVVVVVVTDICTTLCARFQE